MSGSELYMQDPNESFDLPRWQTQVDPLSSSSSAQAAHGAQASYHYQPPPPSSHLAPTSPPRIQAVQHNPTGPSRQPRISQLLEQEHALAPPSNQFVSGPQTSLSRSASLGAASSLATRRRHPQPDDIEAYSADSQTMSAPRQPQQLSQQSYYGSNMGGYQSQSIPSSTSTASPPDSYNDGYYNGSASHSQKRLQDANLAPTHTGRSPHRTAATPNSTSLLDPYAQQSQYSPTTATYSYGPGPPLDQRTQPSAYQTHARNNSQLKTETATPPISSVYGSQSQHHVASYPSYLMNTSNPHLPSQVNTHLSSGPKIQTSISNPPTPMSYMPTSTPGSHYYSQDTAMSVDPPAPRRSVGFRRVRNAHDLQPRLDLIPAGRRMGADGTYLSVSILSTDLRSFV
mgnify:CR=1 FL=1